MDAKQTGKSWTLPLILVPLLAALIAAGLYYQKKVAETVQPATETPVIAEVSPSPSPAPEASPSVLPMASNAPTEPQTTPAIPDLSVDTNGLSKATVVIRMEKGTIKFKFYPKEAPNTVNRLVELIGKGFYNGLTFHRVVPGFVVQGGDPVGNGTGGSGQKLRAEFNARKHVEGAVAMARAADPDSADSQFYISLGLHPHLDNNYTVFGQVVSGMDIAKKITIGDRMLSVTLE